MIRPKLQEAQSFAHIFVQGTSPTCNATYPMINATEGATGALGIQWEIHHVNYPDWDGQSTTLNKEEHNAVERGVNKEVKTAG